jgi:uncharacterized repeat protein (TIGR03803 family)
MNHKIPICRVVYLLAFAVLLGGGFAAPWARAQTLTTLHAFTGNPDGAGPFQANLLDLNGTLYGTTSLGGTYHLGTIFRRNRYGKETVLYTFTGGADGAYPNTGLVQDKNGNFYGTTQNSGFLSCLDFGKMFPGCGTVFRLDTKGALTVLHAFTGGTDGAGPQGLIIDSAGFLYGTTFYGGDLSCPSGIGCGVVYKMDTSGNETVLYNFTGGTDGWFPNTFLTRDTADNLYGVTVLGGNNADCSGTGCGVVFKLDASLHETPLYTFTGGADGAVPNGALLRDAAGNLYGTTFAGGDVSCSNAKSVGCGVVFRVSPAGQEKVLHTFTGPDGANPTLGLVADASGNAYSTTQYGGASNMGTVFAINSRGVEKVLYSFTGGLDGGLPESGLILEKGSLYGNTYLGGDLSCNPPNGCGTLFKVGN